MAQLSSLKKNFLELPRDEALRDILEIRENRRTVRERRISLHTSKPAVKAIRAVKPKDIEKLSDEQKIDLLKKLEGVLDGFKGNAKTDKA